MQLPKPPDIYQQPPDKKRFPWGKVIYLTILVILLGFLGHWAWTRTIYLEAPALVQAREFLVQSTETGRIESLTVEIGDAVTPETVVARLNVTQRLKDQWSPEMLARLNESLNRLQGEAEVTAREVALKSGLAASLGRERHRSRELLELRVVKYSDYKKLDLEHQGLQVEIGKLQKRLTVLQEERRLLEELYQRYLSPPNQVRLDLKPPMPGVVILKNRQAGEVVLAGQPVLTLYDPKDLFVKAYVPQEYQPSISIGDQAVILFKDGSRLQGEVRKLYPSSETLPPEYQEYYMTRQRAIIAEIQPAEVDPQKLLYGLTVKVRFPRPWRQFF